MSYPQYEADLYEIYKSEVTGEALFGLAAHLSISGYRRLRWRRLAQLETQTKQRYLAYLQSSGREAQYPRSAYCAGIVFGLVFTLLPWSLAMKLLEAGTPSLITVFERLREAASEPDQAFFGYVLAHEQAIAEFARRERGADSQSLAAVDSLLEDQTRCFVPGN